ncbi:hypothetical protein Btru_073889 [Bulinus truncatus]|nr:hypothetical protein Btru_073889 [Bulinus truncatus]
MLRKPQACFKEKPDVTFNIRMLRNLSLMEIPLLKSWIHNNVMEVNRSYAQGVLTVQIKGYPPRDAVSEDIRYTVLNIGTRKRQTHEVPATDEWEDVCSFFIYNLASEKIKIKSKCMATDHQHYPRTKRGQSCLLSHSNCETTVENKDGSKMVLTMHYTVLPPIKATETTEDSQRSKSNTLSGVMYLCCHGATNVLAADKTGASDPYCVVFCDRKRVLTTPFIPRTRNPRWESWVEFFIKDYTMSSFSFFVYDWDGTNTINDDFLGSVHFRMTESQPEVIKRTLTLGYNKPDEGFSEDKKCGQITFTAVFRPVESVSKSEKFHQFMKSYKPNDYLYKEDLMSPSTMPGLNGRRTTSASNYMNDLLSNKVIVELTILQGKDMVAMDRNGYSDPFCVVSLKDKKVYTTAVKKKTLFPKWNETVTLEMSLVEAHNLTIDVFDKDVISKDFMGNLRLSLDELKELSLKGTSDWFTLDKIKNGKLQLKCQVIAKDTLSKMKESTPPVEEVFDYPVVQSQTPAPGLDITSSSISSIEHHPVYLQSPPKSHPTKVKKTPSDAASHDIDHSINGSVESSTIPRIRMKKTDSSNSLNMLQRFGDRASINSSASISEKFFNVTGKILRVRGDFSNGAAEIYCKIRLEVPGNRLSLFHNTRFVGKSHSVPLNESSPSLELEFEVDKGSGVPFDALLIFTLKHSRKEHVTTKSISLRTLLADTEGVPKWVPVGNGVEIELVLYQGQPTPGRKRSNSLLKSLSFRKDKPA